MVESLTGRPEGVEILLAVGMTIRMVEFNRNMKIVFLAYN